MTPACKNPASLTGGRAALASLAALPFLCLMTACGPNYSPDTYSSNAVQQANKVDQGVVVGVRPVAISADATIATGTGGAVGGIAGSQVGAGAVAALGAVGGTVAGGVVGNVVGHTTGDTYGYEYIVRKGSGDLLSVTQKDSAPLAIGQHVLIIEGPQARIVVDYTVQMADAPHPAEAPAKSEPTAQPAPPVQAAPAAKPDQASGVAAAAASQPAPSEPVPASTAPASTPPAPAAPSGG